MIRRHEEKETDVAIAVGLLDLFYRNECDVAVLVTGDSDIVPAVRYLRSRFPAKSVMACFPYNRESLELKSLVRGTFRAKKEIYARSQFPDPFLLPDGSSVPKPRTW